MSTHGVSRHHHATLSSDPKSPLQNKDDGQTQPDRLNLTVIHLWYFKLCAPLKSRMRM